jgi:hypothetical protein
MEKSIETMEKTIEPMANSMKIMERSMNTLGKSMNTMEKSMNSANGKILASQFSKVQVFVPKCSNARKVPQTEKQ